MDFSDSSGAQAAAWAVDFAVVRHDDGEQRRIVKKKWPSLVPRWFGIREMRARTRKALCCVQVFPPGLHSLFGGDLQYSGAAGKASRTAILGCPAVNASIRGHSGTYPARITF